MVKDAIREMIKGGELKFYIYSEAYYGEDLLDNMKLGICIDDEEIVSSEVSLDVKSDW